MLYFEVLISYQHCPVSGKQVSTCVWVVKNVDVCLRVHGEQSALGQLVTFGDRSGIPALDTTALAQTQTL